MANLKYTSSKGTSLLSVAAIVLCATTAVAQSARDKCRPAPVIPLASEPPAKIVIDPPLAEPLASRGVVLSNIVLRTCTLCRCSAQMLWLSRRASDTFM
jgi:hypothetical protein